MTKAKLRSCIVAFASVFLSGCFEVAVSVVDDVVSVGGRVTLTAVVQPEDPNGTYYYDIEYYIEFPESWTITSGDYLYVHTPGAPPSTSSHGSMLPQIQGEPFDVMCEDGISTDPVPYTTRPGYVVAKYRNYGPYTYGGAGDR